MEKICPLIISNCFHSLIDHACPQGNGTAFTTDVTLLAVSDGYKADNLLRLAVRDGAGRNRSLEFSLPVLQPYHSRRVLLEVEPGVTRAQVLAITAAYNGAIVYWNPRTLSYLVEVATSTPILRVINDLATAQGVRFSIPDISSKPALSIPPSDPLFGSGLYADYLGYPGYHNPSWHLANAGAPVGQSLRPCTSPTQCIGAETCESPCPIGVGFSCCACESDAQCAAGYTCQEIGDYAVTQWKACQLTPVPGADIGWVDAGTQIIQADSSGSDVVIAIWEPGSINGISRFQITHPDLVDHVFTNQAECCPAPPCADLNGDHLPDCRPGEIVPDGDCVAEGPGCIFIPARGYCLGVSGFQPCVVDSDCPDIRGCYFLPALGRLTDGCPGACGVDDDGDGGVDNLDIEVAGLRAALVSNERDDDMDCPGDTNGDGVWCSCSATSTPPCDANVDEEDEARLGAWDDDEDGLIDDIHGFDFTSQFLFGELFGGIHPARMSDKFSSHATFIAGLIAAGIDNGIGVVGVHPRARLMPVGMPYDRSAALHFMRQHGAAVVNMSFEGSLWRSDPDQATAIENSNLYFEHHADPRALYVAAAGNEGTELTAESALFPQTLRAPSVITVAATTWNDDLVEDFVAPGWASGWSSNFGATFVELSAPGACLGSTTIWLPGNEYLLCDSGTSYSAPLVAAGAGLLVSLYPDFFSAHPLSMRDRLMVTADVVPSHVGKTMTAGRLDLHKALDTSLIPMLYESCNGLDDDGIGGVPDDELDLDGDSWVACFNWVGSNPSIFGGGDCDDTPASPTTCGANCHPGTIGHPAPAELCNGFDDDCDGLWDEGFKVGTVCTVGVGACLGQGTMQCTSDGSGTECNAVPGGVPSQETCDGVDNDCDGLIDAADPDLELTLCELQAGVCAGSTHPAARCISGMWRSCRDEEYLAYNPNFGSDVGSCDGLDDDCDGSLWNAEVDNDGDGFVSCLPWAGTDPDIVDGGDCADLLADVDNRHSYPGAPELCDGFDNNCDGTIPDNEFDHDGDGYVECTPWVGTSASITGGGDCLDHGASASNVHPWAPELCDGFDNNCDGTIPDDEFDHDGDGYVECASWVGNSASVRGGGDCLDQGAFAASVHPGAPELCNTRDDDCDRFVDAADPDLVLSPCELTLGVCREKIHSPSQCVSGTWQHCGAQQYGLDYTNDPEEDSPTQFICDTKDNNCINGPDESCPFSVPDLGRVGVGWEDFHWWELDWEALQAILYGDTIAPLPPSPPRLSAAGQVQAAIGNSLYLTFDFAHSPGVGLISAVVLDLMPEYVAYIPANLDVIASEGIEFITDGNSDAALWSSQMRIVASLRELQAPNLPELAIMFEQQLETRYLTLVFSGFRELTGTDPGQNNQSGFLFPVTAVSFRGMMIDHPTDDFDRDADGLCGAFELSADLDPLASDSDGDSVPDGVDNCPREPNQTQTDGDEDGLGDVCDQMPSDRYNDSQAPKILVMGVEDGARYFGLVAADVFVSDRNLALTEILLNGQPYVSGSAIFQPGDYHLEVLALDLSGNTAQRLLSFELRYAMPPLRLALCAWEGVSLVNNASVLPLSIEGEPTWIASHGDLRMSNNAMLGGNAVAGGALSMTNNARITGDAHVAGTVQILNNAQVGGALISIAGPVTTCDCNYDMFAASASASAINDNLLLESDPAIAPHLILGGLEVGSNATLVLPAGDFYLTHLSLSNNASVVVEPGTLVRLFINGDIVMGNNADLNCPPASGSQIVVVSTAQGQAGDRLELKNNTDSVVEVFAPAADIELENNADLYGGIVGRNITVSNNGGLIWTGQGLHDPPLTCSP